MKYFWYRIGSLFALAITLVAISTTLLFIMNSFGSHQPNFGWICASIIALWWASSLTITKTYGQSFSAEIKTQRAMKFLGPLSLIIFFSKKIISGKPLISDSHGPELTPYWPGITERVMTLGVLILEIVFFILLWIACFLGTSPETSLQILICRFIIATIVIWTISCLILTITYASQTTRNKDFDNLIALFGPVSVIFYGICRLINGKSLFFEEKSYEYRDIPIFVPIPDASI